MEVSEIEAELRWLADHPYKDDTITMQAIRKHGNLEDVNKLFSIERSHWGDEWERLCKLLSMMMQDCEEQSLVTRYSEFLSQHNLDQSSIPKEHIPENTSTEENEKDNVAQKHESLNGVQLATALLQWAQVNDNELLSLNREIADLQFSKKRSERDRAALYDQYIDVSSRLEELRRVSDIQSKEIDSLKEKCSNLENNLATSYRIDKSLIRQELDELRHSIKGAIRLDIKELYSLKPEDTDWYDIVMACVDSITEALGRHGINVKEDQALNKTVEPTSVTPFSCRSMDKALHAAFVALVRHRCAELCGNNAASGFRANLPIVQTIREEILEKVGNIAPNSREEAAGILDDFITAWHNMAIYRERSLKYAVYDGRTNKKDAVLVPAETYAGGVFPPTMNSMRNIDTQSGVYMIRR